MEKYTLLPEQLLYEGTVTDENFFAPPPLETQYITNTHTPGYWHRLSTLQLTPRKCGGRASTIERDWCTAKS
jgi:hypothetical protein